MAIQQELGRKGEELAVRFLEARGFRVLHRNWRNGHHEIDIIAEQEGRVRFVEVKTRSPGRFGHPEMAVNKKKLRDLLLAADAFLRQHRQYTDFRLDILSIIVNGEAADYFFIEDVYL